MLRPRAAVLSICVLAVCLLAVPAQGAVSPHSLRKPVTDENFYFVMADRFANGDTANDHGGIPGGKAQDGFDPTGTGWYHGGDLKGLLDRIDYIKGLGTDSIWLTPSFKNKAVQPEDNSAGYHGYWITDFTQIDPHLGTNADLRALVDAAHARGMKVYFDIITNHTADVIGYEEGARQAYVSKDAVPYRDAAGRVFDDRDYAGTGGFPALDASSSFPYTPVLDPAERDLKVPGWLNDVTLYHNRGDTTFTGEDSLYGDFFGLDDLFTENPRVVRGMIGIYRTWIREHGHRRLPDRHDEARRRRVLAALRAGDPALRPAAGQARLLHVRRGLRHVEAVPVALHDDRQGPGRARLPVPGRRAGLRGRLEADRRPRRRSSRTTTGTRTPTRTSTRCRRSSATTTWAGSGTSSPPRSRAPATRSGSPATSSPTR